MSRPAAGIHLAKTLPETPAAPGPAAVAALSFVTAAAPSAAGGGAVAFLEAFLQALPAASFEALSAAWPTLRETVSATVASDAEKEDARTRKGGRGPAALTEALLKVSGPPAEVPKPGHWAATHASLRAWAAAAAATGAASAGKPGAEATASACLSLLLAPTNASHGRAAAASFAGLCSEIGLAIDPAQTTTLAAATGGQTDAALFLGTFLRLLGAVAETAVGALPAAPARPTGVPSAIVAASASLLVRPFEIIRGAEVAAAERADACQDGGARRSFQVVAVDAARRTVLLNAAEQAARAASGTLAAAPLAARRALLPVVSSALMALVAPVSSATGDRPPPLIRHWAPRLHFAAHLTAALASAADAQHSAAARAELAPFELRTLLERMSDVSAACGSVPLLPASQEVDSQEADTPDYATDFAVSQMSQLGPTPAESADQSAADAARAALFAAAAALEAHSTFPHAPTVTHAHTGAAHVAAATQHTAAAHAAQPASHAAAASGKPSPSRAVPQQTTFLGRGAHGGVHGTSPARAPPAMAASPSKGESVPGLISKALAEAKAAVAAASPPPKSPLGASAAANAAAPTAAITAVAAGKASSADKKASAAKEKPSAGKRKSSGFRRDDDEGDFVVIQPVKATRGPLTEHQREASRPLPVNPRQSLGYTVESVVAAVQ